MTKSISLGEYLHIVLDHRVSEYNESFVGRLYQMDLDWNDLLDTDPKHYEVTDEQINQLF